MHTASLFYIQNQYLSIKTQHPAAMRCFGQDWFAAGLGIELAGGRVVEKACGVVYASKD